MPVGEPVAHREVGRPTEREGQGRRGSERASEVAAAGAAAAGSVM